jgi:hypothetical protein
VTYEYQGGVAKTNHAGNLYNDQPGVILLKFPGLMKLDLLIVTASARLQDALFSIFIRSTGRAVWSVACTALHSLISLWQLCCYFIREGPGLLKLELMLPGHCYLPADAPSCG